MQVKDRLRGEGEKKGERESGSFHAGVENLLAIMVPLSCAITAVVAPKAGP